MDISNKAIKLQVEISSCTSSVRGDIQRFLDKMPRLAMDEEIFMIGPGLISSSFSFPSSGSLHKIIVSLRQHKGNSSQYS